ncbi:hypothetical protein LEM8419_03103 [Neolewinella maritima]|uniref:alpha-L-rhamnosidase n=1 Tax=Neolewinella maritima TaxID=1383882 RepID=A0ABM9B4B6_9BACT|nr:glycoside hydrolase family 78 protein [Neolewinella maritima]CAH1002186.1 hypothetical protein LEM8419_03103 [Neolewinella maritima]
MYYLTGLFLLLSLSLSSQTAVGSLVCEYHENPVGIDVTAPRLSWKLVSDAQDVRQSAYEIRVAKSPDDLVKGRRLSWESGRVASDQSVNVAYAGPPVPPGQRRYWQVRVYDQSGTAGAWSAPAYWELAIAPTDFTASWITLAGETGEGPSLPSHYYRKDFTTRKKVARARLYATSLGVYEMYLNGEKVGDRYFTPGFTSYDHRLQYQTYDVTDRLAKDNTLGAMVGDGWYHGYQGWKGERAYFGDTIGLLAQLVIDYTDGSTETIGTDGSWTAGTGAIAFSDMFNGETYDARHEPTGWAMPGFSGDWAAAAPFDHSKDILVADNGLPVKAIEELPALEIITTPAGETVFDLGQNMVGWVRLKVSGEAGDSVTLKFAEVLDKDGNFYTKNLRRAKATDTYVLKGGGEEVYEPHFTFHGFRYVQVIDYPGTPTKDAITGVVIHSAMTPTGSFTCSDPLINQLQSNIEWGQKDNFLDIPTDCPQRDERAGWTGDAQVFSATAAFNFDVASFYTKWMKDLAADQLENGLVTHVVPDIMHEEGGATAWGDAATVIPWNVYLAYGDVRMLEQQYASMQGWVEFMNERAGEDRLWNNPGDWHWGDWLAFHSDRPDYAGSVTEKDLIATAYFYHSTDILRKTAEIIGKEVDAAKYAKLAEEIRAAFIREYTTATGRLVSDTQTAYALAISFGLLPEEMVESAGRYFAATVEEPKHLTTGFVGTPLLNSTLSKIGRDDLAYMLLNRREYPGWLYPVTQGATTIWERWDTQKPDGTIIEGMNSFNHYAYGAIGEWLYTHVAGIRIDPEQPGYKHIIFDPHPGGGLTHAAATHESMYGTVSSSWRTAGGQVTLEVTVPPNTTGTVLLPDGEVTVGSGTYTFTYAQQQAGK